MNHNAVLTAALNWRGRGVIPVPLKPRSKRPAIAWGRLRASGMPPIAVVKRWFAEHDTNLGLLCGPASGGLAVLDFDRPLFYHRWRRDSALDTYTVRTGRGYHAYLKLEQCTGTLAMEGGEIKGSGYVVAPPSIHPSGSIYQALDARAPILEIADLGAANVKVCNLEYTGRAVKLPDSPADSPSPNRGLIDNIKRAMPLHLLLSAHTQLAPSSADGRWLMARCPFHDDKRPSMWVDTRKNHCRCLRPDCAAGRAPYLDIVNVYAMLHDISNAAAIHRLAAELGL